MTKQAVFSLSFALVVLFHCTTALAQPADVVELLKKEGRFTVFIRLLKNTGVVDQVNSQLKSSALGFTIFAPNDKAFTNLRPGTINKLSDLQKVQLIQYHVLGTFVPVSSFQTLSNPVPTQAGDTSAGEFPLNVTSSGKQVGLSTGVISSTVSSTIYSDDQQLAIYEVDKVLLPLDIFKNYKPLEPVAETPTVSAKVDKSAAVRVSLITSHANAMMLVYIGIAVINAAFSL